MSLMRTDRQMALNDLHLAMQESADIYQQTAQFLQDPAASALCKSLASDRERLAEQIAEEIRDEGELPSAPDRDKETLELLEQRLETLFAQDQVAGVITHRLEGEKALAARVRSEDFTALEAQSPALLNDCRQSVEGAVARLSDYLGE
ncbi:DUF2383 domain-containing protein [Microbulbifer sp. Q7]|uniref:DUF2383 domain-containing protein n=1 Tax=Microbulbifer sp. Q7 TaxID=1785091 RepID=UPI00083008AC|nr:DUF2383 domain-containing protein [Microbulbifer sp. Q7]